MRKTVLAFSLALFALAVYANSLPGAFLWDDLEIVRDNPLVRSPDLRGIFTTGYWWQGSDPDGLYRPLTILSFAANGALFGMGPESFHLVNVVLHSAVSVVFFLFLLTLGIGTGTAWLAAALFAVHPIHTEVVNLAVGRSELQAALFVFLGLAVALRSSRFHLPAAALCYGAALFSKEHAATFPVMLFLADAFTTKSLGRTVRRRIPLYLALAAVTGTFILVSRLTVWRAPPGTSAPHPADNALVALDAVPRLLTALKVQLFYLGKLLLPLDLQLSYGRDSLAPVEGIASAWGMITIGAFALLILLAVHGWRRRRGYAFGMAFYAVAAAVTANIFFLVAMMIAERFTYLSSAGFCLAAASLAGSFSARFTAPKARRFLRVLALCILAALGGLTLARNSDFRSSLSLWKATVETDPGNPFALLFLARAYDEAGMYQEAEGAFRSAQSADASIPGLSLSYGSFLIDHGSPERAEEVLRRSLDHRDTAEKHNMLGISLAVQERTGEARKEFQKAMALDPGSGRYRKNYERALREAGEALP